MEQLSEREREVLGLLQQSRRNREIASELFIGVETVKTHLTNIYRKLGLSSRGEAIAIARASSASGSSTQAD